MTFTLSHSHLLPTLTRSLRRRGGTQAGVPRRAAEGEAHAHRLVRGDVLVDDHGAEHDGGGAARDVGDGKGHGRDARDEGEV